MRAPGSGQGRGAAGPAGEQGPAGGARLAEGPAGPPAAGPVGPRVFKAWWTAGEVRYGVTVIHSAPGHRDSEVSLARGIPGWQALWGPPGLRKSPVPGQGPGEPATRPTR